MKKRKVTFTIVDERITHGTFHAVLRTLPGKGSNILWQTPIGFVRVTNKSTSRSEQYELTME